MPMMGSGGAAALSGQLDDLGSLAAVLADPNRFASLRAELQSLIASSQDAEKAAKARIEEAKAARHDNDTRFAEHSATLKTWSDEVAERQNIVAARELKLEAGLAALASAQENFDAVTEAANKEMLDAAARVQSQQAALDEAQSRLDSETKQALEDHTARDSNFATCVAVADAALQERAKRLKEGEDSLQARSSATEALEADLNARAAAFSAAAATLGSVKAGTG
jgi:chromosome segregation ATPase